MILKYCLFWIVVGVFLKDVFSKIKKRKCIHGQKIYY